jgi:hypothetical protein
MNKTELLAWLNAQHAEFRAVVDPLSPARWNETGMAGFWTMKDVLAHLTGWNRRLVADIQAVRRGEPKPPPPWPAELEEDDDKVNAWIYESNRGLSPSDLLADEQQVFEQLLAVVESFPADVKIETVTDEGREFYLIHWEGTRLHPGEFFDHYRDDHEAEVKAWLAGEN